jgi:hypothetical protein
MISNTLIECIFDYNYSIPSTLWYAGVRLTEVRTPQSGQRAPWEVQTPCEIHVQPVLMNCQDDTRFCLANLKNRQWSKEVQISTVGTKGAVKIQVLSLAASSVVGEVDMPICKELYCISKHCILKEGPRKVFSTHVGDDLLESHCTGFQCLGSLCSVATLLLSKGACCSVFTAQKSMHSRVCIGRPQNHWQAKAGQGTMCTEGCIPNCPRDVSYINAQTILQKKMFTGK